MSPEKCGYRRSMNLEPLRQMSDRLLPLAVSRNQFRNYSLVESVLALSALGRAVGWSLG
jgi:hypothetical protein